jgi:small multidrug resistance pump
VFGYLAALRCLVLLLRRGVALGLAYGIWGALGVAGTALLSTALYGESLSAISWIGLGLVMVGVLVVEAGSRSAEADRQGRG